MTSWGCRPRLFSTAPSGRRNHWAADAAPLAMPLQPNGSLRMLPRLLTLGATLALVLPAAAHETVATEKPVVMPANTGKPGAFATLPGFQVERVFFVPKEKFGSWVSITTDPKGRLVCSDQERKGLYRITPGKVGTDEPAKVEKLDINITAAQGLLFAFDSLYISVNGGPGSGLYRAKYDESADKFG